MVTLHMISAQLQFKSVTIPILEKLRDLVCTEIQINLVKRFPRDLVAFQFCSTKNFAVTSAIFSALISRRASLNKKAHLVKFPELATDELKWTFIRGPF